ncbi:MAG: extracellular solute-binding protein [Chloroflexi bacterium]|nr:extracellular solute-binding protein [Chloroflexota bacterium]
MKKLAIIFLLLFLALTVISCGGNTPNTNSDTNANTASDTNADTASDTNADTVSDTNADTTSDTDVEDTSETAPSSEAPVQITILGTIKPEIQEPFEEAVKAYNESQDEYEVVIIPRDSDPVQMMTSLFASGNMPTIVNMGQEFSLFQETSCDITDAEFSQLAFEGTQADVTVDGRVYGMPITIEAFGLLYNKAVLDEAIGGDFDPATINTRSALAELLAQVDALDSTDAAIHVSGLDWSLGAHFTNVMFTDQSPDATARLAFIDALRAGNADLANNAVYNSWLETLDMLLAYNQNADSPLAPTYDDGVLALADGEVGFWFMGNWALPNLLEANPDVEYGILPVPISDNPEDYGNAQISIGVPSNLVIDCEQSTPEQQAGAIDFLNWFITDPVGQDYWVNQFNFLPVFEGIAISPADAMSNQIIAYAANGQSLQWMNNRYPAGGWQDMGANMQKYVVGELDAAGLAGAIENYWANLEE